MGLVTGPHARVARTHSQLVAGPCHTPQGRAVGRGRAPNTRGPTRRQQAPPSGALVPHPQRAQSARKSARGGFGDRSPRPHTRHRQPVGSGPRTLAPRTGSRAWESAQSRGPIRRQDVLPRAPSCRPLSAQSRLARARRVGLVPGPHANTPRTHSQWVAGPGRTPQGRAVGRGRAPHRGHPTPRKEMIPPGRLLPPHNAQSQLARVRAVGLVASPHTHTPRSHSKWVGGPRQTPQGPAVGRG